jgi:hypothetical protein
MAATDWYNDKQVQQAKQRSLHVETSSSRNNYLWGISKFFLSLLLPGNIAVRSLLQSSEIVLDGMTR